MVLLKKFLSKFPARRKELTFAQSRSTGYSATPLFKARHAEKYGLKKVLLRIWLQQHLCPKWKGVALAPTPFSFNNIQAHRKVLLKKFCGWNGKNDCATLASRATVLLAIVAENFVQKFRQRKAANSLNPAVVSSASVSPDSGSDQSHRREENSFSLRTPILTEASQTVLHFKPAATASPKTVPGIGLFLFPDGLVPSLRYSRSQSSASFVLALERSPLSVRRWFCRWYSSASISIAVSVKLTMPSLTIYASPFGLTRRLFFAKSILRTPLSRSW